MSGAPPPSPAIPLPAQLEGHAAGDDTERGRCMRKAAQLLREQAELLKTAYKQSRHTTQTLPVSGRVRYTSSRGDT